MESADYGFTKTTLDDGGIEYSYKKAKSGSIYFILAIIPLMVTLFTIVATIWISIVVWILYFGWIFLDLSGKKNVFRLYPEYFEVGNKKYAKSDTLNIGIQNIYHENGELITYTNGSALSNVNASLAQNTRAAKAAVSFRVSIQYGRKKVPLAKGLRLTDAETLLEDVARTAGYN